MKSPDLIGTIAYLLAALVFGYQVYRLTQVQNKHIEELKRMVSKQQQVIEQQNQRQVGFLTIFKMLLEQLHEHVKRN